MEQSLVRYQPEQNIKTYEDESWFTNLMPQLQERVRQLDYVVDGIESGSLISDELLSETIAAKEQFACENGLLATAAEATAYLIDPRVDVKLPVAEPSGRQTHSEIIKADKSAYALFLESYTVIIQALEQSGTVKPGDSLARYETDFEAYFATWSREAIGSLGEQVRGDAKFAQTLQTLNFKYAEGDFAENASSGLSPVVLRSIVAETARSQFVNLQASLEQYKTVFIGNNWSTVEHPAAAQGIRSRIGRRVQAAWPPAAVYDQHATKLLDTYEGPHSERDADAYAQATLEQKYAEILMQGAAHAYGTKTPPPAERYQLAQDQQVEAMPDWPLDKARQEVARGIVDLLFGNSKFSKLLDSMCPDDNARYRRDLAKDAFTRMDAFDAAIKFAPVPKFSHKRYLPELQRTRELR